MNITSIIPAQDKARATLAQQEIQVLERAMAFSDDQWCQEHSARDAAGNPTHIHDPAATRRCALGRLDWAISAENAPPEFQMTLRRRLGLELEARQPGAAGPAQHFLDPGRIAEWNDQKGRAPAEVRELFQQALATLRQETGAGSPAEY